MRRSTTILLAIFVGAVGCGGSSDAGKAEAAKKAEAKQAEAKLEAGRTPEQKADARAEPHGDKAKALDTNAQDTNTPKNDTAGDVPPDSLAPTARPTDVPADWQRVAGDVWSFWVPMDWKVDDFKPADGGTGDKGDKIAAAPTKEQGMDVATLSCWIRSDLNLPTEPAAMQKEALERAKGVAKKHEAKAEPVKVEHDDGPRDAYRVEYAATGDGTLVRERWTVSQRALALVCTDETGKGAPEDTKTLETVLGSLRWAPGS